MNRRGLFLSGLAAALGLAAAPAAAKLGHGLDIPADAAEPVQYGPPGYGPPPRRFRRRRCRLVQRRVLFRDRFGRLRERFVKREVCR